METRRNYSQTLGMAAILLFFLIPIVTIHRDRDRNRDHIEEISRQNSRNASLYLLHRGRRGLKIVDRSDSWTAMTLQANKSSDHVRDRGPTVLVNHVRKFVPSPVFNVTNSTMSSNYGPVYPEQVQAHHRRKVKQVSAYREALSPVPIPLAYANANSYAYQQNEPANFMLPPQDVPLLQPDYQYSPPIPAEHFQHPSYGPNYPQSQHHQSHSHSHGLRPHHHKRKKIPFRILKGTIIGKELLVVGTIVAVAGMVAVVALIGLAELVTNMRYGSASLPLLLIPVAVIPFLLFVPAFLLSLIYVAIFGLEEEEESMHGERRLSAPRNSMELPSINLLQLLENIERNEFQSKIRHP